MPKGKRSTKAGKGLVAWAEAWTPSAIGLYRTKLGTDDLASFEESAAKRAGCPRLKPGEVRKVRVTIEPVE